MHVVPPQVTDFLKQSGPFDMLDSEQLHAIARHSHIIYLAAENQEEMLTRHKNSLYLIQSGQFSVKDCDGALKHLSEGDYFGYAALSDNVSYKLDVTVDSPGLVLCMPKAWFYNPMFHP